MAENKIPVLTEVYKPQKSKAIEVTPEMLATVGAQIRPAIEAEVKEKMLAEMHAEMKRVVAEMSPPAQQIPALEDKEGVLDVVRDEVATLRAELMSSIPVKSEILGEVHTEMDKVRGDIALSAQQALGPKDKEIILHAVRAELEALRGELLSSTPAKHEIMDEVKAELDKVREAEPSEETVADLAARMTSQVKPRLEAEITDFALDEVRAEIKKARGEIILSTEDFIDKTKADLKTEMPKMYQNSIDLAQIDLSEKVEQSLNKATEVTEQSLANVSDITEKSLVNVSEVTEKSLANVTEVTEQSISNVLQATEQLNVHQAQLISQHQSELKEAFDNLHQGVSEEVKAALRDEMVKVQDEAVEEHQTQLNEALNGFLQIKGEEAERSLLQQMQAYQSKARVDYQEQLAAELSNALEAIKQRIEESTEEQANLMDTQVGTIQQETFAKLREELIEEKDKLFNDSSNEIKTLLTEQMTHQAEEVRAEFLTQLNAELPDVQSILQESVQSILDRSLPELEERLRNQLTSDIKQLLNTVKFTLPE